jgi:hypothetical protein
MSAYLLSEAGSASEECHPRVPIRAWHSSRFELAHQTDPALDLAVVIRVVMDVYKVATIQFYIPSDDLGIKF